MLHMEVNDILTKERLINSFKALGITGSQIIEVHTKLSSFNLVLGGARTIVDALLELCQNGGTILMPSQVAENSEPSEWENPAITAQLWQATRNEIPFYDAHTSSIYGMGSVVENFKHRDGVLSSKHPTFSYAAWGRYAKLLVNGQSLHFPLSEESPTARLYELQGYMLLLGTDFSTCTALHLAEYRADCRPIEIKGAMIKTEKGSKWEKYLDLQIDSEDFLKIESLLRKKGLLREIYIGGGKIQLFPVVEAVNIATTFLENTSVLELYR